VSKVAGYVSLYVSVCLSVCLHVGTLMCVKHRIIGRWSV